MDLGFSLQEQVRDDPRYAKASDKEIEQAIKELKADFLSPLACVDRYLQLFCRTGLYGTVSSGHGDKEGSSYPQPEICQLPIRGPRTPLDWT